MIAKKKTKTRKVNIVVYFYMILILLIVLVMASYAWFSISRTPRVSNISLYVNTMQGLEFSKTPDANEWTKQLSYADLAAQTSPLRPVTWSDKDQRFYGAVYGIDGRLTGDWQPLSDERNANRENYLGYYCIGTFYARTDEKVAVSLTPATEIDDGVNGSGTYLIGIPLWDETEINHYDGGADAEDAVRVGIRVTRFGEDGQPAADRSEFFIYEPNCDSHQDDEGVDVPDGKYSPTPSIDGTPTLVPEDRLITQTASVWSEANPVEKNVQIYTFGEFTSDTALFTMEQDEMVMIQIYLWLEGQDVDCNNSMEDALIIASVQFLAENIPETGMDPIPADD